MHVCKFCQFLCNGRKINIFNPFSFYKITLLHKNSANDILIDTQTFYTVRPSFNFASQDATTSSIFASTSSYNDDFYHGLWPPLTRYLGGKHSDHLGHLFKTRTVTGFADFVTTIGDKVIVFVPDTDVGGGSTNFFMKHYNLFFICQLYLICKEKRQPSKYFFVEDEISRG